LVQPGFEQVCLFTGRTGVFGAIIHWISSTIHIYVLQYNAMWPAATTF
jgi:hypothetical protein